MNSFLFFSVFLSLSLFSFQSNACGSGPCAAGFGQRDNGSFYVRDFTPSYHSSHQTMSSRSPTLVARRDDGKLVIEFSDGSTLVVVDIDSLETHGDVYDLPAAGGMNFFPQASGPSPYAYWIASELLPSNSNNSDSPFGRTVYSGKSCTGTCRSLMGNLDSVAQLPDGGIQVNGWACDRLSNKSIDVHVYAGGPAGSGTILKGETANLKLSDSAKINKLCGTTVGHRFRVKIPMATANKHRGKPLYVHGISVGPNYAIPQSGGLTVPTPKVMGTIDSAQYISATGKFEIRGWACEQGVNKSTKVHVYGISPSPTGTKVGSVLANQPSSAKIGEICGTTLGKHRFVVNYDGGQYFPVLDKRLYIHAIATMGGPHYVINHSGQFKFPDFGIL